MFILLRVLNKISAENDAALTSTFRIIVYTATSCEQARFLHHLPDELYGMAIQFAIDEISPDTTDK